jgi:hypothetical protein
LERRPNGFPESAKQQRARFVPIDPSISNTPKSLYMSSGSGGTLPVFVRSNKYHSTNYYPVTAALTFIRVVCDPAVGWGGGGGRVIFDPDESYFQCQDNIFYLQPRLEFP